MCGLLFAQWIDPGVGLSLRPKVLKAKAVTAPPLVETLLNIVPINPMEAFT